MTDGNNDDSITYRGKQKKQHSILQKLRSCYFEQFEPPGWIGPLVTPDSILRKTICYYDSGVDESRARKLLRQREPTNIESNRLYHSDLLMRYFGYSQSCYDAATSPNLAVYCETPCRASADAIRHPSTIRVLNVIGVALDHESQSDYRFLETIQSIPTRRHVYHQKVRSVFRKMLRCLQDHPDIETIVVHGFGMGVFSALAPVLEIDHEQAFVDSLYEFIGDVWVMMIGPNRSRLRVVLNFMPPAVSRRIKPIDGRIEYTRTPIQAFVRESTTEFLSTTLWVNAWDPFSIVGNGNGGDHSLDGYFGRMTAMQIICWPVYNPLITYVPT